MHNGINKMMNWKSILGVIPKMITEQCTDQDVKTKKCRDKFIKDLNALRAILEGGSGDSDSAEAFAAFVKNYRVAVIDNVVFWISANMIHTIVGDDVITDDVLKGIVRCEALGFSVDNAARYANVPHSSFY